MKNTELITEELLLKVGFKKLYHLYRYEYVLWIDDELNIETYKSDAKEFCFRLVISNENSDENIPVGSFICYRYVDCNNLHELNRLYKSLTGRELTITPPH